MKAIGYSRLSQESDTSIDRQKRHIREYCETNGIELVEIADDGQHSSGFDTERAEYQTVKRRLESGDVDAVVVNDKTRIGRDFDERMLFVIMLRRSGAQLHSARAGHIDLSNPTDAAVESIHAAADDEKKREEIEKAKEAVAERLANGHDHGPPRIGMRYRDDGRYQEPDGDFETVVRVFELLDDGEMSYREIVADVGLKSPSSITKMKQNREWYYERARKAGKADKLPEWDGAHTAADH